MLWSSYHLLYPLFSFLIAYISSFPRLKLNLRNIRIPGQLSGAIDVSLFSLFAPPFSIIVHNIDSHANFRYYISLFPHILQYIQKPFSNQLLISKIILYNDNRTDKYCIKDKYFRPQEVFLCLPLSPVIFLIQSRNKCRMHIITRN